MAIDNPVADFSLRTLGTAAVGAIVAPTIGVSAAAGACICALAYMIEKVTQPAFTKMYQIFPPQDNRPFSFPLAAFTVVQNLASAFAGAAAASAFGLGVVTIPYALFIKATGGLTGESLGGHVYQFLES